jgi:hypothetical protein
MKKTTDLQSKMKNGNPPYDPRLNPAHLLYAADQWAGLCASNDGGFKREVEQFNEFWFAGLDNHIVRSPWRLSAMHNIIVAYIAARVCLLPDHNCLVISATWPNPLIAMVEGHIERHFRKAAFTKRTQSGHLYQYGLPNGSVLIFVPQKYVQGEVNLGAGLRLNTIVSLGWDFMKDEPYRLLGRLTKAQPEPCWHPLHQNRALIFME